ncbi:MAG TPA: S8 family peptidase [Anaerolineales bacterium]|nr:S8 family peptidase [Anaerolineales bacterium]
MKKILLSTISLALVFSLATSSVSAQDSGDSDSSKSELAEHVPGELLVRFSPGMNSAQAAEKMNEMGVTHKREIQGIGVQLVKLPPGLTVEQAMDRFSHLPGVEFAEPNYILHIAETSQVEITDQWGLTRIRTQEAWNTLKATQKNEVLLATVDTGIHKEESDLSSRIWTNPDETPDDGIDNDNNGYVDDTWGWDFVNNDKDPTDDHMHGTAVTSVMVAAQDGAGMVGICPWCNAMAVKVLDSQGSGSLDVVASGIVYAAQNGARVINLSLAGSIGSQTLEDAVNFAWNQGAVVVAAAGNDGNSSTLYPAGYANAISVASTNSADKHSCFSNYKAGYISVAAPGEAIYVIDINDATTGYNYYSGTSLSTPHVTGLAGLILGKDPNLSNAQVRSLIQNSAVDLGSPGLDAAFGYGRIDAYRAVTGDTSQTTPPDSLSSASNTATGYAHARKLVRDSTGKLHLIWHSDEGSLYRIRYATSTDNGNSWIVQPDVFSSPYETYHPALAADDTYLYVAIPSRPNAGSPYRILFTRKPLTGGAWSTAVSVISGNYNAVRPDIYLDPTNGRLHVIAASLDDAPYLYYRASNTQGASWGNLSQFNPSNSSSSTRYASIHANGDNIYIATRTVSPGLFTYYYLYTARSTNGGVSWIDQTQISWFLAFTSGEYGVSLSGIGDRLYMGYEVGSNLYFRRYDGAGWSNYLQLETGDPNNVYKWPTITQASDGQAWMAFEVNGQLYMRHYDGTTWEAKESIGAGNYANLKRGAGGSKVEWVSTICNGSPFDLTYGSRSLGPTPPSTDTPTPASTNTFTPTSTNSPTSTNTSTPTSSPTSTRTPTATLTSTPTATATPSRTATHTPVSSPTTITDLIFADGFESGNLLSWTSSKTDSGDLSVSASAALIGSNGLRAVLDDNVVIYVIDDTPVTEPRYGARFYFDPNSIPMGSGDNHYIFYGYSGTSTVVMRVQFRFSSGSYQLRAALRNDASTWTNTTWFTVSDAPHPIEIDWRAATAAGANNGALTLWIDGTQRANLTGVDNDTRRIDRVRLGAVAGIDTRTRGTYYFDAFESRRQTPIGP